MRKFTIVTMTLLLSAATASAQRFTDKLDRGLIAIPANTNGGSSSGNLVSWRIFGEEYYDTEYNLYRNGTKVNTTPLKLSTYLDTSGNATSKYQVAAVVNGQEQQLSEPVTSWSSGYYEFPVADVVDRNGTTCTSNYIINDISLGDVTGNGVTEFIVKRNYSGGDLNTTANTTRFHHYECYNLKGDRLWWIDLGPNLMAGADEQWDLVANDWDMDGKAECVMRGADNMYIHTSTGRTIRVGTTYVAPRDEYTHQGNEYLLYLNGETGEPYLANGAKITTVNGVEVLTPMAYPLPRFESGESDYATVWGSADTGHRSSKHYFGAPYLDGHKPSIFLGRGCYTRHKMCALDVDPQTHELTQRWRWNEYNGSSPYFGNGFHNFAIADVDWDGRDEIVFGSMVIDDNGKGLCTTGLGHGDSQHCSDFDPYRHGQEQFTCNETRPACTYFNATTGKYYYRMQSTSDDGRAICGNFTNSYPGCVGRSTQTGMVSSVADKVIGELGDLVAWGDCNFRIYWDGDLCEEILNSPGTEKEAAVIKPGSGRMFTSSNCNMNNWTKNNPCATGDIFGDWREEIVVRANNNTKIRIYSTPHYTRWRNYTLWHDHQYRNAMVWQCVGYNQPPHASYFLGEMEGITVAPPPLTMTGRVEVANNNTISSRAHSGEHVIVCENNDTKISVENGVNPHIVTFNVPSWVQGTNSTVINGTAKVNTTYYTCTVEGGAFGGDTRLVKQGDGILTLPKVDQAYTGSTDIWAGTLNFDGTLKNSDLWLNRFAELNSNGGTFKSITMDYAAKLRPGGEANIGNITTETLTLGFGSRVIFDINPDLKSDLVKGGKMSIETKNWKYGPEYLTPVFEFVNNSSADTGDDPAEGRYLIAQFTDFVGDLSAIKLEGLGVNVKSYLEQEDDKLYLVIEPMRESSTIVWKGDNSTVWDLAKAENFIGENGNEAFVTGDNVLFNDDATAFDVTINDDLEADSVIIDNTKSYSFQGTGKLVGNTKLIKRGTGNLTINNEHSFKGGTRISGGTLTVSSLANENQANGNLGSVTTASNKFIIENGAILRTTAGVTQGSPMQVLGDDGGGITNNADFVVSKAILGTTLTKRGTGWMKLNVANPNLNRLVVSAGTVQCVSCDVPAKTVVFDGGTLSENTGTSYAIEVNKGKKGTWNLVDRATYSNRITGEGTLTIYCPIVVGSDWTATRTRIATNMSQFEGTIVASAQNVDGVKLFSLDNGYGIPKGTLEVPADITVINSAKTFRMGAVKGTGTLGGFAYFDNNGGGGANTWQVGSDAGSSTFEAKVTANSNFHKVGTGKLLIRSASDYTGTTIVREGELNVNSSSKLGTGTLTVNAGATLSGATGPNSLLANSSYNINGTLHPGQLPTSTSGIFHFGDKNVTFGASGVYEFYVKSGASDDTDGCPVMSGIKTLTFNGTIRPLLSSYCSLQDGDYIRLWTATNFLGTPMFDLPQVDGLEWDTSRISEGLLFLKVSTGIQGITTGDFQRPTDIYDLNGALVRKQATSTNGLPAGIYVIQGKKVYVK